VAALALTGVIFAVLGVLTGVWAETFDQHAFVANVLITPLALVGGGFYAAERLPQPWRTLTQLDPIYYLVDASRHGYAEVHETSTAVPLAVAAVVAAARSSKPLGSLTAAGGSSPDLLRRSASSKSADSRPPAPPKL